MAYSPTNGGGAQGPPGPQGPAGSAGAQGDQGPQGVQGVKGDTGDAGPQGIQGVSGAAGAQGSQGSQGIQGIQGIQGTQGPPGAGGDLVYAPTPADVAINSTSDITIATKDVANVAAGDQIIMEGEAIILNNSTATRNIIVTLDFDNAFDIEITLPALATSATLMQPVAFRAVCNVRATNLAYMTVVVDMQLAAGIASGTDTSAAATHLSGKGWGTSVSNLTGTLTCALKMRSANATATQTCRLVGFTIRKVSPVG